MKRQNHAISCLIALCVVTSTISHFACAQEFVCSFRSGADKPRVTGPASSAAKEMVRRILERTNVKLNFILAEGEVDNAMAVYAGGQRLIVYNPSFMEHITLLASTDWAGIGLLAHEIGHHVKEHGKRGSEDPKKLETEADEFLGYALATFGVYLEDAQAVVFTLPSEGSESHPMKRVRLVAVERGWRRWARSNQANSKPKSIVGRYEARGTQNTILQLNEDARFEWRQGSTRITGTYKLRTDDPGHYCPIHIPENLRKKSRSSGPVHQLSAKPRPYPKVSDDINLPPNWFLIDLQTAGSINAWFPKRLEGFAPGADYSRVSQLWADALDGSGMTLLRMGVDAKPVVGSLSDELQQRRRGEPGRRTPRRRGRRNPE